MPRIVTFAEVAPRPLRVEAPDPLEMRAQHPDAQCEQGLEIGLGGGLEGNAGGHVFSGVRPVWIQTGRRGGTVDAGDVAPGGVRALPSAGRRVIARGMPLRPPLGGLTLPVGLPPPVSTT